MDAEPRATTFEPFPASLDQGDVPARAQKGAARKQAAKRAADHQGAPHRKNAQPACGVSGVSLGPGQEPSLAHPCRCR
jgi:hypothetical protein